MNIANRLCVSLSSTFNNCHVLFRYLHSFKHVSASFTYSTASIQCRGCHQQTSYNQPSWCQLDRNGDHQISTTTRVVDDTTYSYTRAPSWMQTTVVDGQIFSGKASEPQTSQTHFYLPHLHLAGVGLIPLEFPRDLLYHKSPWAIMWRCFRDIRLAVLIEK